VSDIAELSIGEEGVVTITPVTEAMPVRDIDKIEPPDLNRGNDSLEHMAAIMNLIEKPNRDSAEIGRLIALEIAGVISKMADNDPGARGRFRELNDHVKALRELQKTLTEADESSRQDSLNVKGPKFQFAFKRIVEWIRLSLKDAGVGESLTHNVLMNFGDRMRENEEGLQRELNKIEIGR
jgi:hypothetical protein